MTSPFPKEEDLNETTGGGTYVENARWRVFEDLSGYTPGRQVLLILGDRWTVWKADDFKAWAQRILAQL